MRSERTSGTENCVHAESRAGADEAAADEVARAWQSLTKSACQMRSAQRFALTQISMSSFGFSASGTSAAKGDAACEGGGSSAAAWTILMRSAEVGWMQTKGVSRRTNSFLAANGFP